jgi:hypothetical protein
MGQLTATMPSHQLQKLPTDGLEKMVAAKAFANWHHESSSCHSWLLIYLNSSG